MQCMHPELAVSCHAWLNRENMCRWLGSINGFNDTDPSSCYWLIWCRWVCETWNKDEMQPKCKVHTLCNKFQHLFWSVNVWHLKRLGSIQPKKRVNISQQQRKKRGEYLKLVTAVDKQDFDWNKDQDKERGTLELRIAPSLRRNMRPAAATGYRNDLALTVNQAIKISVSIQKNLIEAIIPTFNSWVERKAASGLNHFYNWSNNPYIQRDQHVVRVTTTTLRNPPTMRRLMQPEM